MKQKKVVLNVTIPVRDAKNTMSFSYTSSELKSGGKVYGEVYLWMNGDYKIEYKGKEYRVSMQEVINAVCGGIDALENNTVSKENT